MSNVWSALLTAPIADRSSSPRSGGGYCCGKTARRLARATPHKLRTGCSDLLRRLGQHARPLRSVRTPREMMKPATAVAATQELKAAVFARAAVDRDEARAHVWGWTAAGRSVVVAPVPIVLAEHVHQDIGIRPVQESRSRVREKALMQREGCAHCHCQAEGGRSSSTST
jgi:hypothetical protein